MFQSIKDALASSESKGSATFNEIMQTKVGNTFTVRLLPFAKDPSKTFFHYYNHGWNSFATGQYVQTLSPQTFGERDPIAEERFKVLRTGSDEEKDKMQAVRRLEKWLVNVYVIDDPANPDNNGKVKILRYGKQLQKIITEAIEGEDSEEFALVFLILGLKESTLRSKLSNKETFRLMFPRDLLLLVKSIFRKISKKIFTTGRSILLRCLLLSRMTNLRRCSMSITTARQKIRLRKPQHLHRLRHPQNQSQLGWVVMIR